jgi:hypothetical protein
MQTRFFAVLAIAYALLGLVLPFYPDLFIEPSIGMQIVLVAALWAVGVYFMAKAVSHERHLPATIAIFFCGFGLATGAVAAGILPVPPDTPDLQRVGVAFMASIALFAGVGACIKMHQRVRVGLSALG